MKQLRIVILVLLAVLLPIRGAVAAAMVCPKGAASQTVTAAAEHGHHDMHADHGLHGHEAASHHGADEGAPSDDAAGAEHAGTCQFCVTGCCVTPLASAPLEIAGPLLTDSVTFPALCAPIAAFQSEGQERPPRTI